MQVLALLLLLASAICMVFAFDVPAVAQEASPDEEMTEEDTMDETEEDLSDEEMVEDDLAEEEMEDTMEEAEEELVDSPLKQMLAGTEPHEIKCKTGQKLVFKASNWRPACINESSFDVLAARGWVASHDPSHEDLMKMQDEYKADVDAEGQAEEEMENETVEDSKETEDEEKTQPRNYSVELKESIDITAP
jgi:hypothetical protein